MVLIVAYFSHPLALSFIEGEWFNYDWVIHNDADGYLFVLALWCLIHRR